jgi:hypothetical protein
VGKEDKGVADKRSKKALAYNSEYSV